MRALVFSLLFSVSALASETMRIAVGPESAKVVVEGANLRVGADADDATFEPFSASRVTMPDPVDAFGGDAEFRDAWSVVFDGSGD